MRLTRAAFWISDVTAWILLVLLALFAFSTVAFGPVGYALDGEEPVWSEIVSSGVLYVLGALGCFGVTRRKPWALLLAVAPALVMCARGNVVLGAWLGAVILSVLGTPFLLVALEVFQRGRSEP